jgi:hypothetical protein
MQLYQKWYWNAAIVTQHLQRRNRKTDIATRYYKTTVATQLL